MPAAKRRKVSTAAAAATSTPRGGLDAFTRVSKRQAATTPKSDSEKAVASDLVHGKVEVYEHIGRGKRRVVEKSQHSDDEGDVEASKTTPANHQRDIKPLPKSRRPFETPRKPISSPAPVESDTPTTKTAALFNRFALARSSPTQWDSSPLRSQDVSVSEETSIFDDDIFQSSQVSLDQGAPEDEKDDDPYPAELSDLINLHAAFLNALSLHYAHNGTHTPADIQSLCPSVALNWKKRAVSVLDIQRALGVQNMTNISTPFSLESSRSPLLTLSNYGNNKICVEIETIFGKKGVMARPLDEQKLNAQYTSNLLNLWKSHCKSMTTSETETCIVEFIDSLPVQAIPTNTTSLEKISPTYAKGARRLADLKASHALKTSEKAAAKKAASTTTSPIKESPQKRGSSLLNRIKAKNLATSLLPPPPTKTELLRISALHRLPEIIQILTLLSTSGSAGQSRVSFTMATVLGKIRDSCRGEIGVDEGRVCLEVLEREVAPGWVRIVGKVGGSVKGAVVIDRERRPDGGVVEGRIRDALAGGGGGGSGVSK